jgi:hypothetical protein
VEVLAGGVDGEGRRFLPVKGAQARVVLRSGFAQLDVFADDADDVCLLLYGICKISGVRHISSLPHCDKRRANFAVEKL